MVHRSPQIIPTTAALLLFLLPACAGPPSPASTCSDCASSDCAGSNCASSDCAGSDCASSDCGSHGAWDDTAARCVCAPGYEGIHCDRCANGYVVDGPRCVPGTCLVDADCNDGNACNGVEACSPARACEPGTPVECFAHAQCQEPSGGCACDAGYVLQDAACVPTACEMPQAPTLSLVHAGAILAFSAPGHPLLQVGTGGESAATPDAWVDGDALTLPPNATPYALRAFARLAKPSCAAASPFTFLYEVHEKYPPAAGEPGSDAVALDDARIGRWATGWVAPVAYGAEVDDAWKTPQRALGPAQGTSVDVVSLGRGGSIVMTFDPPVSDDVGADFAVFENGFSDTFLELAFVEVSTNGVDFLRFDSAYLGEGSVGSFSELDPQQIESLAGKYRQGYGTPFDLAVFVNRPEVQRGTVCLSAIRYVRIVDVVGDGSSHDSFGHPIFDPYPTVQSAGFDLDAIAVLDAP